MAMLCIPIGAQVTNFHGSPNDAKSLDGATRIANGLFPCHEAKRSLVEQRFWLHHTVLKLASCQWPHRPTVAVDEQGSAFLLTDNVLIVSAKSPLEEVNAAAKAESTVIDAGNVLDYLRFFVGSHLNWCDGLYFGDDSMARKVTQVWRESDGAKLAEQTNAVKRKLVPIGDIPVKSSKDDHAFKAIVFEW